MSLNIPPAHQLKATPPHLVKPTDPSTYTPVQKRAVAELERVREFFTRHGFDETRGNGPLPPITFDDNMSNAAYLRPDAIRFVGNQEAIIVGSIDGRQLARDADVLAHEYAHRIVTHNVDLSGPGAPAALGESLADTFAAAISRDDQPWTIGETTFPNGLRSMKPRPYGMDRADPRHARDFDVSIGDNGGAHHNAAIPNHAAYLIGTALGRDAMAKIYAAAVKTHMPDEASFSDAARATVASARELFGSESSEVQAVRDAWQAVGIGARGSVRGRLFGSR